MQEEYEIAKVVLSTMRTVKEAELYEEIPFILQNVEGCLQDADIFINNETDNERLILLKKKLLRYVSLIMNPGLVLPTPVERGMQIAYTAKLNSGLHLPPSGGCDHRRSIPFTLHRLEPAA